ncbi:MAG: glycosyltransferase [Flavobacteriales bacterium]|nr:glycosyltransferase [Flavobacteriales bacterium]
MADFSIITPVLNQVSHIETCILSVLEQDCDVQHIIIDGGSSDGTIDIIRKYENRISYWKSEPDSGQSDAINKGLKLANGTFFNWLNADDRLTPNALQTVLNCIDSKTDVVIGKCEHVDENRNSIAVGFARIWDSLEATVGNYSMGQPSLFYKTSVVQELGGLNNSLHYCMDMDLWFRYLSTFGQKNIALTESILSQFLVHSDSKSVDFKNEMSIEKYGIYKVLLSQFEQPEVLLEFLAEFSLSDVDSKSYQGNLDKDVLLANFCWHLMVEAYEKGEIERCKAFYDIVKNGNRLSTSETLKWNTRFASAKLMRR